MHVKCTACGNNWEVTKPPEEMEDGPRCSECGSYEVDPVEDNGPVLKQQGRKERLRESLSAVPGVGEAGVEYATQMYDMTDASDGPEALYDVVSEIEGVSDAQARRVADAVFQIEPTGHDSRPYLRSGGDSDGGNDDESFIDQLAKAKEAGLLGGNSGGISERITIRRDDGSQVELPANHPAAKQLLGGVEEETDPTAEALEKLGQQIQQSNRMVAQALSDDESKPSKIDDLKAEIEELKQDQKEERIESLREEIREIKEGAAEDNIEALKVRKSTELAEQAPEQTVKAVKELEDTAHSLIDRVKSLERQRAMMQPARDSKPNYEPGTVQGESTQRQSHQETGTAETNGQRDTGPQADIAEVREKLGVEADG